MAIFIHPLSDVQSDKIGDETKIWQFVVILPGARIGKNCNICAQTFIENRVTVGDCVTLKNGVQLWDGITVGNNVFIGPNVTFTNDKYPRSKNSSYKTLETFIEDGASIGAGSTILPGLRIGRDAVIGAGSVVTKDVGPGELVFGNPSKPQLLRSSTTGEQL